MHELQEIESWFLNNSENVTNKKLQKLLYYAYSWFLVSFNETSEDLELKFFDSHFEAWVHGPVCPQSYNKYKHLGSSIIPKFNYSIIPFSDDELDILNEVNNVYGDFSGDELEYISTNEFPWKKARMNLPSDEPSTNVISDKDIFDYYIKQLFYEEKS